MKNLPFLSLFFSSSFPDIRMSDNRTLTVLERKFLLFQQRNWIIKNLFKMLLMKKKSNILCQISLNRRIFKSFPAEKERFYLTQNKDHNDTSEKKNFSNTSVFIKHLFPQWLISRFLSFGFGDHCYSGWKILRVREARIKLLQTLNSRWQNIIMATLGHLGQSVWLQL